MADEDQALGQAAEGDLPAAIIKRPDGIFFARDASPRSCLTAVSQVFLSSSYFAGLDYAILIKLLYNCGPDLPPNVANQPMIRFATSIEPFHPTRRALYKAVKLINGEAEYFFEPVFFEIPDMPSQPARLNFDEFVSDMWVKGVRFGIDAPVVRDAISYGRVARLVVARRLAAAPGRDATIEEVSRDIHRSDAPREKKDGKLDLQAFQNRFPQVKANVRLLRKVPKVMGARGYELSGIVLEPPVPRDLELSDIAGEGTVIEHSKDGEFLVSAVEGFLSIDAATKRLSIGPKIVSREGVSARTTGNLQLTGEYEEFGDVQEQRVVDGGNITIHGDVFGNISSRGGTITLSRNLMGGTTTNLEGDILVRGVASGAVLQTRKGEVHLTRAESCIISASKVYIEEASNCEILAEEVHIKVAEGCAIAARKIEIQSAGPRRQHEMLLYTLVPDLSKFNKKIMELQPRVQQTAHEAKIRRNEIEALSGQTDVRTYLTLATRVRKREVVLTPEQEQMFHKMAANVGPSLRAISKLSLLLKAAEAQHEQAQEEVNLIERQKLAIMRGSYCKVELLTGDVLLRTMSFAPDGNPPYDRPAKDIKAKVRTTVPGMQLVYAGSNGPLDWTPPLETEVG